MASDDDDNNDQDADGASVAGMLPGGGTGSGAPFAPQFFSSAPPVTWSSADTALSNQVTTTLQAPPASSPSAQTQQNPQWSGDHNNLSPDASARLQQAWSAAQAVFPGDPVMARLAMSQAMLESGRNLNSGLAMDDNNLFGIKGTGSAGTSTWNTREVYGGQSQTVSARLCKKCIASRLFYPIPQSYEYPTIRICPCSRASRRF